MSLKYGLSVLMNVLTGIYGKLKYALMSFLLKRLCQVFNYICYCIFVMVKLQFSTFKMYVNIE